MGFPKTRIENASQSLWFCNIQLRVCVCVCVVGSVAKRMENGRVPVHF